jgi:pyridoxamine 5'-phosphate oxidase
MYPPQPPLIESTVNPNPFVQFTRWFHDAHALDAQGLDPTAMTLATASADGIPAARMVLLKSFDERGFVFFSHYDSPKGRDLAENPRAALVFYWAPQERQVRLMGDVTRVAPDESQTYFNSRPREARLSTWASRQSTVLPDRAALEARLAEARARFPGDDIPLPPYWGGFRLAPASFEFWQARPGRLHDRLRYTRQPDGAWRLERLAP